MFDGHRLFKIGNNWVFDLTEFIGYKVTQEDGVIKTYEKAFTVTKSNSDNSLSFKKKTLIPAGVMRKSDLIIRNYLKKVTV